MGNNNVKLAVIAIIRMMPVIGARTTAVGGGLALGREGPTVQMGANVSYLIGRLFRRTWPDYRVLMAAGAGADLATAFKVFFKTL